MTHSQPPAFIKKYLLGLLLLIYALCAWWAAPALWSLLTIGIIAPVAALLMASGTAMLVLGVARSLYKDRLGKFCLLLAAVQLAAGAAQIGNWGYKVSQGMLATLVLGVLIALLGAWRAHGAGR